MGDDTAIGWTDATWNPLRAVNEQTQKIGWICIHKSAGCENCYSETMNDWRGNGAPFTPSGLKSVRPFLDERILTQPLRWRQPRRIFVCSMTDLFGEWVPDEWIDRVFAVMALAPQHTFQVLTKRPDRMLAYLSRHDVGARWAREVQRIEAPLPAVDDAVGWTRVGLPNVWLGVSCEDQRNADARVPLLLQTPAAVRFVSYEPALGPVDFSRFLAAGDSDNPERGSEHSRIDGDVPAAQVVALRQQRLRWDKSTGHEQRDQRAERPAARTIDWIIVGGESGPGHRPMDLAWLERVDAQTRAAGVALFVKQMSGPRPGMRGSIPEYLWSRKEFPHGS